MAPSKGFFSMIACPVAGCHAPDCMFAHADDPQDAVLQMDTPPGEPAIKRRRLGGELTKHDVDAAFAPAPAPESSIAPFVDTLMKTKSPTPPESSDSSSEVSFIEDHSKDTETVIPEQLIPKAISPPPIKRAENNTKSPSSAATRSEAHPIVEEPLNPRPLPHPPAGHSTRFLYLTKLHEAMKNLNDGTNRSECNASHAIALSKQQLITKALDEEAKIATDNPTVYANVFKHNLVAYKKMTAEQWRESISAVNNSKKPTARLQASQLAPKGERPLETGLTDTQERQVLSRLLAKQHGLEQYGYVTSPPSQSEIDEAKAAVQASKGWEQCERCKSRFQVYTDRSEDGSLTSGGQCCYHHGRAVKAMKRGDKIYNCCNEPLGMSVGCTTSDTHVFKVYDPKRLAALVPFECTPDNADLDFDHAVTFDCEMGFTTQGMELLRLTALSWPKSELLLNVLVRPVGTVLDLNTRYSGVSPEQYANAKPYHHSKKTNLSGDLRIVKSIPQARSLLFKLLTTSTPLIGHAIENDLNATRIVHPCIIDTVLLCPHWGGGLPYRRSLKTLAQDYLWRSIQFAGAQGHDSMEDARATGDIVREMVKRSWFKMQRNGWKAVDDKLLPPSPSFKPDVPMVRPDRQNAQWREEVQKQAEAHRMEEARLHAECRGEKRAFDDVDDLITVEMNYD